MIELPIDAALPGIVERLRGERSLVIVATPGAGKSTRVAPALLRGKICGGEHQRIIMLEPRRVAARAIAARMAEENGWTLGHEVGYQVRFEKKYRNDTRIVVLTEGIFTRMLLGDPYLEGIGCVILDEFHERSLHTDMALGFLREIQETVRPELKIVVMSATLDARPVAAFLGQAATIEVAGRVHPVEIAYRGGRSGRDLRIEEQVAAVIEEAVSSAAGDVLAFLPGVGEIERVQRNLAAVERSGVAVVPLHGSLEAAEQQRALRVDEAGRQKVILATNIAETSLTIEGVRVVVDSGLARVASFDADRGMDRLDLERISQASATQRAGRAGRQGPGKAYRLWSELQQKHLAAFGVPEIHRVDLAATVLALYAWGTGDARRFGWFDPPEEGMLAAAEKLLEMLGALRRKPADAGQREITEIGRRMLSLPVHPRMGRMLCAAAEGEHLNDAISLAAILSEDSRRSGEGGGDPLTLLERMPAHLEPARRQLAVVARQLKADIGAPAITHLGALLLLAYPDRVARRRGSDPLAAVMVGGAGLRLTTSALTPALAASSLFLALDVHHDPRNKNAEATVRAATPLEETWLERLYPEQIRTESVLEFDAEREKVAAVTRRQFGDLVLEENRHGAVDAAEAGVILAQALSPKARALFLADEAALRIMARVALLRHYLPRSEHETPWPAFDDGELQALLTQACAGKKSLEELARGPGLAAALRQTLVYPLDRALDQLAPETIEVPSGSHIRLDYFLPASEGAAPPAPVLAVRLQELFGWTDTPRIAGGRVAVLLHLLSPGFKPMQITADLASFWRSAYFEVRKDLRVRYPKHKWPEEPLTAQAEAKGRHRRQT